MNECQVISKAADNANMREIVGNIAKTIALQFDGVYVVCTNCLSLCQPKQIDGGKCVHCRDKEDVCS